MQYGNGETTDLLGYDNLTVAKRIRFGGPDREEESHGERVQEQRLHQRARYENEHPRPPVIRSRSAGEEEQLQRTFREVPSEPIRCFDKHDDDETEPEHYLYDRLKRIETARFHHATQIDHEDVNVHDHGQ
ncbi:MAG: hypothetical protein ACOCXN_10360 [Spirochaetota bacterium]